MPQKFYEGQEFHNPNEPGAPVLVYRAGKFYPKSQEPGGATGNSDTPFAAMTPGSEARARVTLGLGPVVNAQRNMFSAEGGGDRSKRINPFNKQWGAKLIGDLDEGWLAQKAGISLDPIAKAWGGQQYQDYDQAAKSFEAAMLPIMSGAAVTSTEAQRQIRANLPELGDTTLTLERKGTNRAMMANAAADLAGRPRPFPKVGTWDFKGSQSGSQPRSGQPAAPNTNGAAPKPPVRVKTVQEAMALPRGTVFVTPDGRQKVR
jgi:hypothetical protein